MTPYWEKYKDCPECSGYGSSMKFTGEPDYWGVQDYEEEYCTKCRAGEFLKTRHYGTMEDRKKENG